MTPLLKKVRESGVRSTFKISHVVSLLSDRTSSYALLMSGSERISAATGISTSSFPCQKKVILEVEMQGCKLKK